MSVPEPESAVIESVLGLDTRPIAQPHIRWLSQIGNANPHAAQASFTPPQVAKAYDYPTAVNGGGQCIALIELGGGYEDSDVETYFGQLGITPPTVVAVPVDGGTNSPGDPNGADGEVALDIQVAGSIAPGARIAVYFAPNTNQGFQDAISAAIHDTTNKPSAISISWGGPESSWDAASLSSFDNTMQTAAALGVTITVASGDSGSTDGVSDGANHVDFPASSPHVLACGGTALTVSNGTRSTETVWNDQSQGGGATGGGVSSYFALPSWQSARKGARAKRGPGWPRCAGCRWRRSPRNRLSNPRGRPIRRRRRHQRCSPAVGRTGRIGEPADRPQRRISQSHALLRRRSKFFRHHVRLEWQLQGRCRMGPMHRPRLARRQKDRSHSYK